VGRAADIYLVAFAVPEFVFIALPIVLSPAFIPPFAERRQQSGEVDAWHLGLRVAGALLAVLLVFTALAGLGAPLYLLWLGPGFDLYEHTLAIQATHLMLPALSLMGLATLAGAALQVYRRFAAPAFATAVYNLVFITTLFAAPFAWPVGRAAWGVTLGAAAALALQWPLLWRLRPLSQKVLEKRVDLSGLQSIEPVARLAGPLAAGYAVHHLILFIDRAMATTLGPGSAAALNYADRLALVVGQLSGLAVSTALFPRLAEQVSRGDLAGARNSLSGALRLVWVIALPASVGMIILRAPLVQVLFERGAFDRAAAAAVDKPLVWYAWAVLADALCQPLWRAVYAQRSTWMVVSVNGLQTGIRLLCNIVLSRSLGYSGLALSAAVGLAAQVVVLGWLVRRRLGAYTTGAWWRDAARVAVATTSAAIATGLLATRLADTPPIVILLGCGVLGCITYLATWQSLKHWRNLYDGIRAIGLAHNK
jgi:putative peptidoglycan lipid II flippase